MNDSFFLDTNIFVYMFDRSSPVKTARATELITQAIGTSAGKISYQVVQEFFSASAKSRKRPLTAIEGVEFLAEFLEPLVAVESSIELIVSALAYRQRWMLPWYDALILAAALEAGCSILYSEDFQHGQRFGGLRVINPFL